MILEHEIESYLIREVKKLGGECVKFIPEQRNGMPDRIVMLPGGILFWVETKKPKGGKLSAIQKVQHEKLRRLGAAAARPLCHSGERG